MKYEEAMAKAKEFAGNPPHQFKDEFERHEFESNYATRLQFEANFNAWLRIRSSEYEDDEKTDEQQKARCDREDDLAHLILTAPAVYDWMIFRKFEVADYCITKHGDAAGVTWGEAIALTALDSIKADLLRLGRKEEMKLAKEMELARAKANPAGRPAA